MTTQVEVREAATPLLELARQANPEHVWPEFFRLLLQELRMPPDECAELVIRAMQTMSPEELDIKAVIRRHFPTEDRVTKC